ncbi:putative transmembrane protein [Cucumis melo var. makuwa]|uniref:Transmembrane protein n=2 Tax=Cucumis melo TaxID=3656 RepID=A0A5D3BA37_CUCMM|nr:putative transmembrane protein [Cucumis melo var. makuwa]TYJ95987.1 putative transmembrane protein [Cucumis melo var. makuwa]
MTGSQQVNATGDRMKGPSPAQHTTEVLHQRKKLPVCPMRMAIGGFAIAATLGYFVLYTKKKPEASALDVAKVTTGISTPDNTHPRT